MHLNLNDPASVRAWVAVATARHRGQLIGLRKLPLFTALIQAAIDGAKSAAPTAGCPDTGRMPAHDERTL